MEHNQAEVSEFLAVLEKAKIEPNFFASREYIRRAGLRAIRSDGLLAIIEPGTEWAVLPALDPKSGQAVSFPGLGIWSDFYGQDFGPDLVPEFLDYEHIYDPRAFLDLSGSKWSVFRKNVRKWPAGKQDLDYTPLFPHHRGLIENVLIEWLESLGDQEVHDDSVMIDYLLYGDNRWGLFDGDRLVGINVWDYSWKYINYRYCVCRPEPFLSEYMRYRFYKSFIWDTIIPVWKLVNDGGILDRPALKFFKDRLNPIRVREVKSWR